MLRRILLTALGFTLVAASASAQNSPQADRGAKIYAESKCSLCHSIGAQGNKKGPLDEVGTKLKADEIRQWIVTPKDMTEKTKAERKPAMRAYPTLPKDDLDALVAYMLTLKKK